MDAFVIALVLFVLFLLIRVKMCEGYTNTPTWFNPEGQGEQGSIRVYYKPHMLKYIDVGPNSMTMEPRT